MNSSKISDWLQIVGLFGVIASLVFVGLQMKQDREIALSAAFQTRTQISQDLESSYRSNPALISAMAKVTENGLAAISLEEKILLDSYINSLFDVYENLYFQNQRGFLDQEHWEKAQRQITEILDSAPARSLLMPFLELGAYRASFNDYLLSVAQAAEEKQSR